MVAEFDVLDVRQFIQKSDQTGQVLTRQGEYEFEDIDAPKPFSCQWRMARKSVGLEVQGHLTGELSLTCDACQQVFQEPVEVDIQELYVFNHLIENKHRSERELQPDDFYEAIDADSEIDLKDLVHQYLIIETTHHPTCAQANCPSSL